MAPVEVTVAVTSLSALKGLLAFWLQELSHSVVSQSPITVLDLILCKVVCMSDTRLPVPYIGESWDKIKTLEIEKITPKGRVVPTGFQHKAYCYPRATLPPPTVNSLGLRNEEQLRIGLDSLLLGGVSSYLKMEKFLTATANCRLSWPNVLNCE